MLLEGEGYDVVGEAEDGLSAMRLVDELRPDLVLLDIHLPDFDGFEVARRMTANGSAPAIVLVSSRAREDVGPLAADSGALGFITKSELSGETLEALLS
jgi:CheY-like chemotaxis protein